MCSGNCAKHDITHASLQAGHINSEQLVLLEELIFKVSTYYGAAVRVKLQALPYSLTLYLTGFMLIWLLLFPLGLFPEAGWYGLVGIFVITVLFLGERCAF